MHFPPEESEENDLIKQQPETPERGQNLLFSLTLQDPTASKNK